MDQPPHPVADIPRQLSWFAVWRWSPWKLSLIVVGLLTAYVGAEEPLSYLILRRYGMSFGHSQAFSVHCNVYGPMHLARKQFPFLMTLSIAQDKWLQETFGPPFGTCFFE